MSTLVTKVKQLYDQSAVKGANAPFVATVEVPLKLMIGEANEKVYVTTKSEQQIMDMISMYAQGLEFRNEAGEVCTVVSCAYAVMPIEGYQHKAEFRYELASKPAVEITG